MNTLKTFSPRTVPGYVSVLGSAKTNATVSLWSTNSTSLYATTTRKGEYFHGELPLNNSTGAVWMTLTNLAVLQNGGNPDIVTNTIGQTFVAQTPEAFYYDLDGNLTKDGRWAYTWDAENRLVRMESSSDAPSPSKLKLEFAYDAKGRRIQKLVSTNNGSAYVAQYTNRFVYDGWNLVGVLSPNSSLLSSFVWGLDLSGSIQGAGGVGGLLLCRDMGTATTNCVAYDGNGNVAALVNLANGAVSANYEYGPFGEALRVTGALAEANPFRFSTKYQDDETDYIYYGYRNYNPSAGRWLSRDLIGEDGGKNLYGFDRNDLIDRTDALGHWSSQDHTTLTTLSFWEAIYVLGDESRASCQHDILKRLIRANHRQDWFYFLDLKRHYNRSAFADDYVAKLQADEDYAIYLRMENINFTVALAQTPSERTCHRALGALGRMTHSWQDFFAHSIRRDGAGGREPGSPSSAEGWLAWTEGVTGTPASRGNFWPSSYPGEHPWFHEPLVEGGAEYLVRFEAAEDYVRHQLVDYLPRWFEHCKCYCQ